jgi:arginyl-tRNA synthetase
MLKQDANKNFIFDKKEALRFDGNTGPYLLYTYARARSILRKAGGRASQKFEIPDLNELEKNIVLQLASFPETIEKARQMLAPNIIANYAYQIARAFNEFYHSNKVIGSEKELFLLALVDAVSIVIKNALFLLSIETVEKM